MYDPAAIPVEPNFSETWADKPRVHELYEHHWGLSADGWRAWREIVARSWGYVTMIDDLVDDPWELRNLIDVPYRRDVKLDLAEKLR